MQVSEKCPNTNKKKPMSMWFFSVEGLARQVADNEKVHVARNLAAYLKDINEVRCAAHIIVAKGLWVW